MSNKISYYLIRLIGKLRLSSVFKSAIDKESIVGPGSQIVNSSIDRYSYCGKNCVILNAKIGRFCSIADGVIIGASSHPTDYISTSPVFLEGRNILRKNFSRHKCIPPKITIIGHDVWIGHSAHISEGVVIGHGSIVGQGAVVTKNVEPYTIVGGVPARFIRRRFPEDISNEIAATEWWLLDERSLKKYSNFFHNPKKFISEINKL